MLRQIMDGNAFALARQALTGLSRRQETVASNIANVDTPGHTRREVAFEDALRRTLSATSAGELRRTDPRHLGPAGSSSARDSDVRQRDVVSVRNDGNEVSVDEEMVLMVETQIRYQALSQSVGKRIATLRSVIRG
jgi:flagellar basal-body rod protein FlgB